MNKKPRKHAAVDYTPPRGLGCFCKFIAEHVTHNGIWWELKRNDGSTFRARPGTCKVV